MLAIHGGTPVRKELLPYGQQWIDDEDIQAVVNALKGPFLTQGPAIEQLEQAIAHYVGAKYAVAFTNGTAALHGACYAAGISNGDEVITTPITFAASGNCVLYMGGTPIFADIDEKTYNIDPIEIKKKISPKTKAIIAVDFTGQPVDVDAIQDIAKANELVFIQDSAHSLGASYKGKKIGSLADMTMFSFHPVKHITTGEGGMIVTNNEEYYQKLKLFRSHGITKDLDMYKDMGRWYHEMIDLGYNYRMNDLQAVLGVSQFKKLDSFIQRRLEIVDIYNDVFSLLKGIQIPNQLPDAKSSWHLYVLSLQLEHLKVGRREIFDALFAENIGVQVHYIPVYYHPYYRDLGYKKGQCPIAEKWYETAITIPLFPKMTNEDVQDVINAVQKVIKHYSL